MAAGQDPRLIPGAYVTQDRHLYEVLKVSGTTVLLENCRTEFKLSTYRDSIVKNYALVKVAPEVPDTVPDAA